MDLQTEIFVGVRREEILGEKYTNTQAEGADVHGRGVRHAVRVRKCSPLTGACRPEKNGIQKVEITVFLTILRSALSSAADLT